jgi:ubiquinone/menaquinone biosynthesis C-methylase UbiE
MSCNECLLFIFLVVLAWYIIRNEVNGIWLCSLVSGVTGITGGLDSTRYSWKKKVEIYEKYRPLYQKDAIIDALEHTGLDISQSTIVDIGSGTGILTRQIADHKPKSLYAVDPDIDMLNMSRHKAKKLPIQHIQATSDKIPLPDNSVDIITIGTALHWFHPVSTMVEFRRLLKPGGFIMEFRNSYAYKDSGYEMLSAERAASGMVSMNDSNQTRYKWKLDDISDVHEIKRCGDYRKLPQKEYIGMWMSQSRTPPGESISGKKYKNALTKIWKKYKPESRARTRVSIVQI